MSSGVRRRPQRRGTVVISVTDEGRAVASRLPGVHLHGALAAALREHWDTAESFVVVAAAGAVVRAIAPLLEGKDHDPAVVCVDSQGRYAIALLGGHAAGGNDLARRVAGLLGASAVITTASEHAAVPVLDALDGFTATGDVAAVQRALIDGDTVAWTADPPLGAFVVPGAPGAGSAGAGVVARHHTPATVRVTDRAASSAGGVSPTVLLHPPSLVAGIGASTGAPEDEVAALLDRAMREAGLAPASLVEVATLDRKAGEPAITALGLPLRTYAASDLARVPVPTPSPTVAAAVGTPSVAEAAALLAAGDCGELIVTKIVSTHATVAIARRRRPRGRLSIVGLGPGDAGARTADATRALVAADVVVGYGPYLDLCADVLTPSHEVVASPIGDEAVRAKQAVTEAESGRRVALVGSGDAGVYALASLAFEVLGDGPSDCDVEVVPGVTAALAAAARLGAPLGHDHASVSLSDLLTPWAAIERRLEAVAATDFVVSLYNPRSRGRPHHLAAARAIFGRHRPPETPVGVVTDAYRPSEQVTVTTLRDLDVEAVGMTTIVTIGATTTRVIQGRMVTPRGYGA